MRSVDTLYNKVIREPSQVIIMSSRGRYGSRSIERSLHAPPGFHHPLKSLSPIAAQFALESGRSSSYPAVVTVAPSRMLLVQNHSRITTQSIADFGFQTIALLEKLEVEHPHPDAIEAAPFPALTLLLNKFKEFKHGGGMTIQEVEAMESAASVLFKTLDWTETAVLTTADRAGLLAMRKNVREAIRLLKKQRAQGILDDDRRAYAMATLDSAIADAKDDAMQIPVNIAEPSRLRMFDQKASSSYNNLINLSEIAGKTDLQHPFGTPQKSRETGSDYEPIDYHVHGW